LGAHIGHASVRADGSVMRQRHGDMTEDTVARGVDDDRLIGATGHDEELTTVRRDGKAVRIGADVDARHDSVGDCVDDAYR
jgi:hypothetical protein